jgi:hypothetical protein
VRLLPSLLGGLRRSSATALEYGARIKPAPGSAGGHSHSKGGLRYVRGLQCKGEGVAVDPRERGKDEKGAPPSNSFSPLSACHPSSAPLSRSPTAPLFLSLYRPQKSGGWGGEAFPLYARAAMTMAAAAPMTAAAAVAASEAPEVVGAGGV